jgi:hypothetical protein
VSYLLGGGWWTLWYLLLWLALAPFIWLGVSLSRTPLGGASPGQDAAFAFCNVSLVLMSLTSLVNTLLFASASPGTGIGRFLWPVVLYLVISVVAGGGILGPLYYVTGYASTAPRRWGAYAVLMGLVLAIHIFALQAIWRFRHR